MHVAEKFVCALEVGINAEFGAGVKQRYFLATHKVSNLKYFNCQPNCIRIDLRFLWDQVFL